MVSTRVSSDVTTIPTPFRIRSNNCYTNKSDRVLAFIWLLLTTVLHIYYNLVVIPHVTPQTQIPSFTTIMLTTTRICLFAVLLSYNLTPILAFDFVVCFLDKHRSPHPDDCQKAINLIPDGTITWDGKKEKPLQFHLPPAARQYTAPAVFRSASCLVSMATNNRKAPDPPASAASEMYYRFWPEVRSSAQRILTKCFSNENNSGQEFIDVKLGGSKFKYIISVSSAPVDMPRHGEKWVIGTPYNVYDTAGASGALSPEASSSGASSSGTSFSGVS